MLDRRVFVREMTLLHERFGRSPNKLVMQRYYEALAERLTTSEFERAAKFVFNHDQFWPAPMRFVEVVQGNPDDNADQAWRIVLEYATKGKTVISTDPHITAGLRAAGGITSISRAEGDYALASMRKAFTTGYKLSMKADEILRLTSGEDTK
jgi:hypothetical protein